MTDYTESGCLAIVESAYKKCLTKTQNKEDIETRQKFVDDGVLFKLWCYLTNRREETFKNLVTLKNHKNCVDFNIR